MNKERKLIIAGNWKMNKTVAEGLSLVRDLKRELAGVKEVDIVVCPPFTALDAISKEILDSNLRLGAQNMSENNFGAYTGEICAGMLKEFSVRYVILGHSERRQYQKEADALIAKKALAVHGASLKPIVCVGEKLDEHKAGKTNEVLVKQFAAGVAGLTEEQFKEVVIAYEPVWAIGTGQTATPEIAAGAHRLIRQEAEKRFGSDAAQQLRILYGGSVKPDNIQGLMKEDQLDGTLVGGASLDPDSFIKIVHGA